MLKRHKMGLKEYFDVQMLLCVKNINFTNQQNPSQHAKILSNLMVVQGPKFIYEL